jgi:hypothetical protein
MHAVLACLAEARIPCLGAGQEKLQAVVFFTDSNLYPISPIVLGLKI